MHFFLYPDQPYSWAFWWAMDMSGPRARGSLVKYSPERGGLSGLLMLSPAGRRAISTGQGPPPQASPAEFPLQVCSQFPGSCFVTKRRQTPRLPCSPPTFTVVGTSLKIMSPLKADQTICGREGQGEVVMSFPSFEFLNTCWGFFQNYSLVAVPPWSVTFLYCCRTNDIYIFIVGSLCKAPQIFPRTACVWNWAN